MDVLRVFYSDGGWLLLAGGGGAIWGGGEEGKTNGQGADPGVFLRRWYTRVSIAKRLQRVTFSGIVSTTLG